MKNSLTLLLCAMLIATTAHAQEDNTIYIQVDYMKALPGHADDYVWMENTIYKPIHQERIRSGEIIAWHLYEVQYPRGAEAEYDYVTLSVYSNFGNIDEVVVPYEDIIKRAHPDKTVEQVNAYAADSRELVRSEVIKSLDRFPINNPMPAKSILVDYMKVAPMNEATYTRMETDIWKPLHVERKERARIVSWGLYEIVFPSGLNHPYSHATATGFKNWGQIKDSWPEDIWTSVHPNASQEELEIRAHATRDLVSSQIWKLIDFTMMTENGITD